MKKLRVLHTPHNNGGHRWLLSREERKLGISSDLVVIPDQPYYQKNYDRCLHINSKTIPNEVKRYLFLKEAIKKYDIFHFNAGASILDHPFPGLNLMDLGMLKKAGKKIVVTYQGDDCRQKDYYVKNYGIYYRGQTRWYSPNDWYLDLNKRLRIQKFDKYADHILAISPDIMNFLPKRTELLPTCVDLESIPYLPQKKSSKKIRILHAPSDRNIKGTTSILEVVKELMSKYPIELVLIEKMSHDQALIEYAKADIAVDQLVVGWYGTFAVELLAMGVPVIAYLREQDLEKFVPWRKEITVISATKDDLKEAVSALIENKMLRQNLGRRGRKFVEKRHNVKTAAKRLVQIYQSL